MALIRSYIYLDWYYSRKAHVGKYSLSAELRGDRTIQPCGLTTKTLIGEFSTTLLATEPSTTLSIFERL